MTTQDKPTPDYQTPADQVDHGDHVGHVVPLKLLVKVFVALVTLTVLTVAASEVNFGEFNLVVALAIAVVKASLVVLFFMHLYWDKPFNSIVFIGCLIFVSLFISLSLLDSYQYRNSVEHIQAPKVPHVLLKPGEAERPAVPGIPAPVPQAGPATPAAPTPAPEK